MNTFFIISDIFFRTNCNYNGIPDGINKPRRLAFLHFLNHQAMQHLFDIDTAIELVEGNATKSDQLIFKGKISYVFYIFEIYIIIFI